MLICPKIAQNRNLGKGVGGEVEKGVQVGLGTSRLCSDARVWGVCGGGGGGVGVRKVRAGPRGPAEKRLWAELGAGWRTVSRTGGVVGSRSRGTAVAGPWAAVKDGPSRSGHMGWHTSWWRMHAGSHPAVRPAARALSNREQTGVRNNAAFGAAGVGALRAPRWANGTSRARRAETLSRSSSARNVTGGVAESAAPRTVKKR